MIDLFAQVTGDHQWIHTDPARAAAGPFGTTIAHGYLLASLIPTILAQTVHIDGIQMAINYGSNKVRFIAPVPVNSQVRGIVRLDQVEHTPTGARVVFLVTIELEHASKPACVIETINLLVA